MNFEAKKLSPFNFNPIHCEGLVDDFFIFFGKTNYSPCYLNCSNPILKDTTVRIEEVSENNSEFEKSENKNKEEALIVEDVVASSVEEILEYVADSFDLLIFCLEDEESSKVFKVVEDNVLQ